MYGSPGGESFGGTLSPPRAAKTRWRESGAWSNSFWPRVVSQDLHSERLQPHMSFPKPMADCGRSRSPDATSGRERNTVGACPRSSGLQGAPTTRGSRLINGAVLFWSLCWNDSFMVFFFRTPCLLFQIYRTKKASGRTHSGENRRSRCWRDRSGRL